MVPVLAEHPQLGKGRCFKVGDDFLVFDLKTLTEPLVQQPTFVWACQEIGDLRFLSHQLKRSVKLFEGLVVIDAQAVNALLSGDALFPNPLLLLGEQLVADLVVVVSREKLAFLTVELRERDFSFGHLLAGQQRHGFDLGAQR